jgi:radical SAM protein with 4Fe4S-binding SPASM domain
MSGQKRSKQVIDLNFAKCGIKDFFEETQSYQLRIFSNGEPLMSFKRVCEITDYARSLAGSQLFVELQTNGYFNRKVTAWVGENIDMLWISLDGPEDVQNHNRPTKSSQSSFHVIDENITRLKQYGKTKIGLRPTITDYNVDRQIELIDYAQKKGITAIYAYPWASFLGRKDGQPDLFHFADEFLKAREYAEKIGIYYGTIFMINFDEEVEINCRSLLPAPHLTIDGYISCCDMMNNGDGLLPDLIYGKYNPETQKITYYQDKIDKIRTRNIHHLPDCQQCEVLKHCAGGCIGSAIMASWDFYGINPDYCKVTKYLFKHLPHIVNIGYNKDIPLHP